MSAAPSIATVKARIEAIAATIPGITTVVTAGVCKLNDADLPALEVMPRGATRTTRSTDQRVVTREYEVWVYVCKIVKNTDPQAYLDAVATASAWCDVVPDFFNDHAPRLQLNNAPLAGVWRLGEISDDGPGVAPFYDGFDYGVVRCVIPVETQRAR